MGGVVRIGIVGDFDAGFFPHTATDAALGRAAGVTGVDLAGEWVPTGRLADAASDGARLAPFDALWIAPGSPYRSFDGALNAVRYARERGVPLLAT